MNYLKIPIYTMFCLIMQAYSCNKTSEIKDSIGNITDNHIYVEGHFNEFPDTLNVNKELTEYYFDKPNDWNWIRKTTNLSDTIDSADMLVRFLKFVCNSGAFTDEPCLIRGERFPMTFCEYFHRYNFCCQFKNSKSDTVKVTDCLSLYINPGSNITNDVWLNVRRISNEDYILQVKYKRNKTPCGSEFFVVKIQKDSVKILSTLVVEI